MHVVPRYGYACDYTLHVQWTDYSRPMLNYRSLFSTALSGASIAIT